MMYWAALVLSLIVAAILVPIVIRYATQFGAIDHAGREERKIHKHAVPRAGGVAIYLSFVLVCLVLLPKITQNFIGLLLAGTIVLLVGLYDDVKGLSPWIKLCFQILAAAVAVVGFGISIDTITNPFGQAISLSSKVPPLAIGPFQVGAGLIATVLSIIWLVGITNTINLLDGLDGLSGGVSAIAAFIVFLLAISPSVNQPDTALIAITLTGASLGYLVYNFYPAKIFNGDSGAYFLGMTLGILAIFSGAKLATAALVLGVPIFDAIWAFIRRIATGRSPFSADRGHFHHLLIDVGLSQRQAVLLIYAISITFGLIALIANTGQKVIAIATLICLMVTSVVFLTLLRRRKNTSS